MNILERNLRNFLESENLVGKPLLLCISGGIDSMVLLDVAQNVCGDSVSVFHLDHNARENSSRDMELVKSVCEKRNTPFFPEKIEGTPVKNKENQWRTERKTRAEQRAKKIHAKRILTAHHATDLVETMIFRLTKGCGIEGLSPFDISTKPFWDIPKSEIISYAQENKLLWNEDESNLDTKYSRNAIRQKVLPELRTITPNLEKVFVHESIVFQKSQEFLQKHLLREIDFTKKEIPLNRFLELEDILQMMFLRYISKNTPSFSEVEDCLSWLRNTPEGNTHKTVGQTPLRLQKGLLFWE